MTYEDRDTWIKNKLREQKEIEERLMKVAY